jgi:RHS repeat-associated protein
VGRRQSKTINGVTTSFFYDGFNVVQELNGATPTANLLTILGIDETLLQTDAAGPRAFLTDGLGSTLALTDSAGLVQSEYTYEPFGKTMATGAASTNAFKYTGREDDGTGLYYYRARYYHPALQRFLSEDPIGFAGGDVNLYGYVGNGPVNFVDPEGLGPITLPGGGMSPGQAGMAEAAISGFGPGPLGIAKLGPITKALGPHTTWKTVCGKITRHETWTPNPRNPKGWDSVQSTDVVGKGHGGVPTPHTQGPGIPGGVRPAQPGEIPGGSSYP